jgi:hypothetical protein
MLLLPVVTFLAAVLLAAPPVGFRCLSAPAGPELRGEARVAPPSALPAVVELGETVIFVLYSSF